jgi:hypothetical protein
MDGPLYQALKHNMRMTVTVYPTVALSDLKELAETMRVADRKEVILLSGQSPIEVLQESVRLSSYVWTVKVGELVVCMFGLVFHDGVIVPWLLGTDLLFKLKRELLVLSQDYMKLFRSFNLPLANVIHAENTQSLRWLRWLGFEFSDKQTLGFCSVPSYIFTYR